MQTAFVFAERGHGTALALELRRIGVSLIGICATKPPSMVQRIKTALAKLVVHEGWPIGDPFSDYPAPAELDTPFFDRTHMASVISFLRNKKPTLIIACGFPSLIPTEALVCAGHAINLHPGLLPERPGGTPNRWAIYHGDKLTGVTAHYMTGKFDSGEIIYRKKIPIKHGVDWGELERSLTPFILEAGVEVVKRARDGLLVSQPNPVQKSQPSLRGKRILINWESGAQIARLCRALRPKTGALAFLEGRGIHFWDGYSIPKNSDQSPPGTIISIDDDGPHIACKTDNFKLTAIVVDGKIRDAGDYKFKVGDRFS